MFIGEFAESVARSMLARGEKRRAGEAGKDAFCARLEEIHGWFRGMTGVDACDYEKTPFSFETVGRERKGNRCRETRRYRFGDGTVFPADAYIPDGEGGHPAVLFLCGHTNEGRKFPDYVAAAEKFVSEGFFVLMADPIGQGERAAPPYWTYPFREDDAIYAHARMARTERAFGTVPCAVFYRDILHQLCALRNDPAADGNRIAVAGHSGGGMQTAMLMLGGAAGVSAFAPSCYITDMRGMLDNRVIQDDEQIFRGMLKEGFDYCDMLLAAYPAEVLALGAEQDFFPIGGFRRSVEAAGEFAERGIGHSDIRSVSFDIGHRYDEQMANATAAFFHSVFSRKRKKSPPRKAKAAAGKGGDCAQGPAWLRIQAENAPAPEFDRARCFLSEGSGGRRILLFADPDRQDGESLSRLLPEGDVARYRLLAQEPAEKDRYSVGFDDPVFNSRAHADNIFSLCGSSLAAVTVREILNVIEGLEGQFDEIAADGLVELCVETAVCLHGGIPVRYLGNERDRLKQDVRCGADLSRYAGTLVPGILKYAPELGLFGL